MCYVQSQVIFRNSQPMEESLSQSDISDRRYHVPNFDDKASQDTETLSLTYLPNRVP